MPPETLLLSNGFLMDGSGKPGFTGQVLIQDGRIAEVSESPIPTGAPVLDCTGKVIAPGFIDAHSHMDWMLPLDGQDDLKLPFLAQGCTSFVGGNCGFGVAGYRKQTAFRHVLKPGLFLGEVGAWDTVADYRDHLRASGPTHNLALFAGHGTTRISMRGMDPSPLSREEMKELLALLEQAMDEGAIGVSLGLQYAPGLFATKEEISQVARLVQRKDKVLAVHGRAYSVLSAEYAPNPFGTPHNLRALQEAIAVARDTGVRLQYSHLIFAGTQTHPICAQCLDAIDAARTEGLDIGTDSYPYHCGNSILGVILPKWFRERLPGSYGNLLDRARLRFEFAALTRLVGLSYPDIQVTAVTHPEFKPYEGMFLSEIAHKRKQSPFDCYLELAEKSGEQETNVLLHNYSTLEIIDALMQHPACLFMTDALPGVENRNPATYGSFPRFLQYARERKKIALEEAVRKMTGATADRFGLTDRGYIRKGMAADITVFDRENIRDNTTNEAYDRNPTGIDAVFVNGQPAVWNGTLNRTVRAGQFLA